jgi:hypothetical protein
MKVDRWFCDYFSVVCSVCSCTSPNILHTVEASTTSFEEGEASEEVRYLANALNII